MSASSDDKIKFILLFQTAQLCDLCSSSGTVDLSSIDDLLQQGADPNYQDSGVSQLTV